MSEFTDYLAYLNQASEDVTDSHAITERLGAIAQQLTADSEVETARQARLNQEVLAASKSLPGGVGFQISFTQTDENGATREVGWPDTTQYGPPEYAYLQQQYDGWHNLYLKSEYGLFLYLRNQLRTNKAVGELAGTFLALGQSYLAKHRVDDDRRHYATHAILALERAFYLANSRKSVPEVAPVLQTIVAYLLEVHRTWEVTDSATLLVLARITELFTEHYKALPDAEQATALLNQDWTGAEQLARSYRQGAIDLARSASELAAKAGADRGRWSRFQAQQYERLAEEAEASHNMTAVHFAEQALRIYRRLKDAADSTRLEQTYQRLRTAFALTKTSTPLPDEATEQLLRYIEQVVAERSPAGIIAELVLTPMFRRLDQVAEAARTQRDSFAALLPVSITDKQGNTVQTFTTAEEKEQFQFLSTYGMLAQISTGTLVKLMLEAYKAGKLRAADVADYLRRSWLGQTRWVEATGERYPTEPLRLLMSGINLLFRELDAWQQNPSYEPDFVAATDTLTLKVEYVLRYMCARLEIPTFKLREGSRVIMEKLFDELLADLKGRLEEDDRFFIKFFLSEKVGQNLRNRVAHGLLDDTEYGVENAFVVLTMLLKLAAYDFTPVEQNGNDN